MSVISGTAGRRGARSRPRRRGGRGDGGDTALVAGAAAVLGSVAVALALNASLLAALALIALLLAVVVVARLRWLGVSVLLVAALPWLVVFGAVEPRLTETFTAGAAVVSILIVAAPRHDGTRAARRLYLGMGLFYASVLLGLARTPGSAQFIEAAKYIVFPFTVLAISQGTNRRALSQLSRVALISGAFAVTANLVLGVAGFNRSYYNAGDIQGLGGQHDVALLDAAVTAAALGMRASWRWTGVAAVGAVATVATGVRSALPGLLLVVLVRMSRAGARARSIVAVGLVVGAVIVSGADNVLLTRITHAQQSGQFASFSALGSGRGGVWTSAIHGWWTASPVDWFIGTGLRSVNVIELHATGTAVVAQNDVIQVGVEMGLIGLAGLILIWWTLITSARSRLPLLVLLPFALLNGALEYGAPLVITLLLTQRPEQVDPPRPRGSPEPQSQPADADP